MQGGEVVASHMDSSGHRPAFAELRADVLSAEVQWRQTSRPAAPAALTPGRSRTARIIARCRFTMSIAAMGAELPAASAGGSDTRKASSFSSRTTPSGDVSALRSSLRPAIDNITATTVAATSIVDADRLANRLLAWGADPPKISPRSVPAKRPCPARRMSSAFAVRPTSDRPAPATATLSAADHHGAACSRCENAGNAAPAPAVSSAASTHATHVEAAHTTPHSAARSRIPEPV